MTLTVQRPATQADLSYIYNSYLTSLRRNSDLQFVPKTIYFPHQTKIINFLLQRSECLIICHPDDHSQIIGYILYQIDNDTLIIHFSYIRDIYWSLGICSNFINQLIKIHNIKLMYYTHQTKAAQFLRKKLSLKAVYNPYLIPEARIMVGEL